MKRRRVVELAVLGGVTLPLAGCANEATEDSDGPDNGTAAENGNETTGNESAEAGDDSPTDESTAQTFTGSGSRVIEDVSLEGGLTIVDATHEGAGDFQVRLIPDGERGTLFADSSGAYAGQTAWHMDDGTYQLSVVADGNWEVNIRQPRETSGETPPLSLDGTGNEVHGPFEFDGSYQPSGEHDGEKISVNVLSSTDDSRSFVFHEDSIQNPIAFEFEGTGYIEIKSDGEWSLEIE